MEDQGNVKAARDSQVSVAIKSLYDVSGEIGTLVEKLETRLAKVVRAPNSMPEPALEIEKEVEEQVQLSANLKEIKFSLKNSKEKLNSIFNRLEL